MPNFAFWAFCRRREVNLCIERTEGRTVNLEFRRDGSCSTCGVASPPEFPVGPVVASTSGPSLVVAVRGVITSSSSQSSQSSLDSVDKRLLKLGWKSPRGSAILAWSYSLFGQHPMLFFCQWRYLYGVLNGPRSRHAKKRSFRGVGSRPARSRETSDRSEVCRNGVPSTTASAT